MVSSTVPLEVECHRTESSEETETLQHQRLLDRSIDSDFTFGRSPVLMVSS